MWCGLGGKDQKTQQKSQKQRLAREAGIWVGPGQTGEKPTVVSGPLHSDRLTTLNTTGPHTGFRETVTLSHPGWSLPECFSYKSWMYGLRLDGVASSC